MADPRPYDLVVFGATGFTGQFVVDEVAKVAEEEGGLSWAVAGRNMEKLQTVLVQSSERTGKKVEDKPIIIADVSSYQSLLDMSQQTKVVLNCVGPYRFHGEQVVKACIEGGANCVDISGEPQFLEKVQLLYSAKAKEANVYVVGSCGFDSIPVDMGVHFTRKNFKGDLNSVEGYLTLKGGEDGIAFNYATFESAVYGFAYASELANIRKSLFPDPMPRSAHRVPKRYFPFYKEDLKKWCLPFPSSDRSVVARSQRYFYDKQRQRPVQFVPYICEASLFRTICYVLFSIIFAIMSYFSVTRSVLLKFPQIFTAGMFKKDGPSLKQIKESSFSWTLFGSGYSEPLQTLMFSIRKSLIRQLQSLSVDQRLAMSPPICMVQSAMVLLKEKERIPKEGGVYTPAAVFGDSSLVKRLDKHEVTFQVHEQ
ncbi:LOW QUALITY PROTEIN: saccharopine dehydrogenase-like oxidoreductase [Pomacea canaliculata]|uniref:LOW QUALITY PROTEIN: saccharopine dehydrogenase-like oxidoreductase n=1 Tax=Pomacea canaliculata TaxID=400727 RepID=UPI000D7344B7|nr:LOW QUALITY PROTEIN: saccharopine dehydrogenase-like oxidoreductase [Pomacea canaliculata]